MADVHIIAVPEQDFSGVKVISTPVLYDVKVIAAEDPTATPST